MASKITGDAELKAKLRKLTDLRFLKKHMKSVGHYVKGKVSKYPPPPPKNKTPGNSWYDRGQGSKYMRMDGGISSYGNSEDLGQSWTVRTKGNTGVTIGNDTTYGKWVQGPDDQSELMGAIGWKTTDDVADEEKGEVLYRIKKAVNKELARLWP